ncbi:TetR/AcrR family transcriptional regulator [Candidatus Binatia bacterium]|nr:TetR/AcrR family transcriptional regulator [Candidatus Binatia bacterium]
MPAARKQTPRPYLAAGERRLQLLDVARRLVREGGWSALSMQGLAIAAGVSRQLVYEHFESADDLYLATLRHLFERIHAATEAVVRAGDDLETTLARAFELFVEMAPEERDALRALASLRDPSHRRMARAKSQLRARITALWVPYIEVQTGLHGGEAQAVAWMLVNAAGGLADGIAEGSIERRRGVALWVRVARDAIASLRDVHGRAPR